MILEVQNLIDRCEQPTPMATTNRAIHYINKYVRTGGEMQLSAQLGDYDMDEVVLDLGLEVNVLRNRLGNSWESRR